MDWEAAERRHDPASVEGRLWHGLRALAHARAATRAVHGQGRREVVWTHNDHVLGLFREHAGARLLLLANFSAERQAVPAAVLTHRGFPAAAHEVVLEGYAFAWVPGE
jgi:amylosucrase